MSEIEKSNLNQIEAEINVLKNQTAQNIIEIGRKLNRAKELVPHGEWIKWLEEKVTFTRQTANKFMRIADEYSNVNAALQLGTEKLWLMLEVPQEKREEFIQENQVEDMTTRELRQAIKEKRELEKQVEELKNQEPKAIEVEKEVYPNDYWDKQKRIEELQEELRNQIDPIEYERLRKELTDKNLELYDIKQQREKEKVTIKDSKEVHLKKLKDTAIVFSNRVHSFINDVGGLGWLIEYLDEIPSYEQEEYIKAIELLDRWVTTIKSNL